MPDTKRTRNTSELTISDAVAKTAELYDEEQAALANVSLRYEARREAILMRVPEEARPIVLAKLNGMTVPVVAATPADPAPVYTAERMQEPLSPERKKIAGMK